MDATFPAPVQKYPKLTLHLYDHCPYCVRVQLALGWKGIPHETKLYGYGAKSFSKVQCVVVPMLHGANVVGDTLGDSKGKYYGGRTLTGHKALPVLEIHGRTPSLVRPFRVVLKNMCSFLGLEKFSVSFLHIKLVFAL